MSGPGIRPLEKVRSLKGAATMRRPSALVFVVAGLAGCASVPTGERDAALQAFPVKPDVAGVYIYCDEWMGVFYRNNVEIDGKPFGQLASRTYLHAEVPPGKHMVTVKAENADTLELDANAGGNYYVLQEVKLGWFSPRVALRLVSDDEGRKGVGATRHVEPTYATVDRGVAKTVGATLGVWLLGAVLAPAPQIGLGTFMH